MTEAEQIDLLSKVLAGTNSGEVMRSVAAALSVADVALIPTRPSSIDLTSLPLSLEDLATARQTRPDLQARAAGGSRQCVCLCAPGCCVYLKAGGVA